MKEYPEPDYTLRIWDLISQEQPAVARFLKGGWILRVNNVASTTFLPYLPIVPWPPPTAADLDVAHDRDEAARVVLSTSMRLVTPTEGPERIEELVGEIPERQTVFWVSKARYASLDAELDALHSRLYRHDDQLRLSDLAPGALRTFLQEELPRSAALSEYEREILCLKPLDNYHHLTRKLEIGEP